MNNIFMGTYSKDGLNYDYSGIWSRTRGRVDWKAIVRHADVLCRPKGTIHEEPEGLDIVGVVTRLVEEHIDQALIRR